MNDKHGDCGHPEIAAAAEEAEDRMPANTAHGVHSVGRHQLKGVPTEIGGLTALEVLDHGNRQLTSVNLHR